MPKTTEPKREGESRLPDADEALSWLDRAPIDREFGSPDYERLVALDQAAFAAFHFWDRIRQCQAKPNPQLNGTCPDDVARISDGLSQILSAPMVAGDSASDDVESSSEGGTAPKCAQFALPLAHRLKQFTRGLWKLRTLVDQQRSL